MKTCNRCNQKKELGLFAKGSGYKDGRRGICKKCHSEYMTKYYKDNPNKLKTAGKIEKNWRRHHITEEKYAELFCKHDGKCHACKINVATNVDHDHQCCNKPRSCGKCVRGLLCHQCNSALGLLGDDRKKIKNLLEYIK
jgi:hypothetical protein